LFIKKNFKARHQILKVLFDHDLNFKPTDSLDKKSLHFDEICNQLPQYDRPFLLDNLDYLRTTKEIHCSMQFDNSTFAILSHGSHSCRDKKYIRDGIKDFFNYIYDIAKTVSVIVLLLIAIWTFVKNIYQTESNKQDIEQIRKEIQQIKDKPPKTTLPKKTGQ
jgi:hypothetical protein